MFDNAQSIIDTLWDIFPEDRFNIDSAYGGMSLRVSDSGETDIYLRVAYRNMGTRVEISSIILDEDIRHKGYFTKMIKNLYSLQHVTTVIVPNILTDEMKLACAKNGMSFDDAVCGYVLSKSA